MTWLWITLAVLGGIVIGIALVCATIVGFLNDLSGIDSMQISDRAARRMNKRYERQKRKELRSKA